MSDEQTLLLVLAVIYLADCVYWVPRGGFSVTRWISRGWKLRYPSQIFGNQRGAFALANPLPPLGLASRTLGTLVSLSTQGVISRVDASPSTAGPRQQEAVFYRWPEISGVQLEEKKVLINGQLFLACSSEYASRRVASEILMLARLGESARADALSSLLGRACSPEQVRDRIRSFLEDSSRLRILGNALFAYLFVICPAIVWRFGLPLTALPICAGLYVHTVVIALAFRKAHRRLYPLDSGQIFKPFLTMLLAAPSAIRAQDLLGRPLLEEFHPLAVAKALCSKEQFEDMARWTVRDWVFPRARLLPEAAEGAHMVEAAFRRELLRQLTENLNLDQSELLKAPAKSEAIHTQYCPRCHQQFTAAAAACGDCGGRELQPL